MWSYFSSTTVAIIPLLACCSCLSLYTQPGLIYTFTVPQGPTLHYNVIFLELWLRSFGLCILWQSPFLLSSFGLCILWQSPFLLSSSSLFSVGEWSKKKSLDNKLKPGYWAGLDGDRGRVNNGRPLFLRIVFTSWPKLSLGLPLRTWPVRWSCLWPNLWISMEILSRDGSAGWFCEYRGYNGSGRLYSEYRLCDGKTSKLKLEILTTERLFISTCPPVKKKRRYNFVICKWESLTTSINFID
jgi:hypothetical protein